LVFIILKKETLIMKHYQGSLVLSL